MGFRHYNQPIALLQLQIRRSQPSNPIQTLENIEHLNAELSAKPTLLESQLQVLFRNLHFRQAQAVTQVYPLRLHRKTAPLN